MRTSTRLLGWTAIALLMTAATMPLWAGGDDIEAKAKAETGDQVLKSGSNSSIALGQSLGDVDIEGCIVTTQWGIVIYQRQKYEYDVFCIAKLLDGQGKHEDAAVMRCTDKKTSKLYGDRCIEVMTFTPIAPAEFDDSQREEDELRYLAQQEELEYVKEELANIRTEHKEAVTAVVQQAPMEVPQQQPWMTEETRRKLQAVLDEDSEDE